MSADTPCQSVNAMEKVCAYGDSTRCGCPMRVVSDAAVAFAAGTPQPAGSVLIAGTGAIAAAVRGRDVRATAGGHGWLLGDEGSGFWLGREAVRSALAVLDGRRPTTALTRAVVDELLGTRGAAWLAAAGLAGLDEPAAARLHARLVTGR